MSAADVSVERLRCEYLVDPAGIDVTQPRLSWELISAERGQTQTAYQVLVAASEEALAADNGDLWDSGKAASEQSIHVVYAGKPLTSRMRCYWKVRAWDKDGTPSAWSAPARWTMGLLAPADWKGKWLASPFQEREDAGADAMLTLSGAKWIWFPEGEPATQGAPAGDRYFRKVIGVGGQALARALVMVAADNACTVYVNGKEAGKHDDWKTAVALDVTEHIQKGKNVIAIEAHNDADPAGLVARVFVQYKQGNPVNLTTDGSWKANNTRVEKWETPEFDDAAWPAAMDLGAVGIPPWGEPVIRDAKPTQTIPSPLFRKTFEVAKPVKSAQLSLCGLGYSELHLNGAKVDDRVLDPAFTRYDKRALYTTYDVAAQLRQGVNALGVMLGNGWYNVHTLAVWDFYKAPWRGAPRMLLQLDIEFADGTAQTVVSDESWKAATGPVVFDGIRNGETYDARLERPGWDTADFSDGDWKPALVVDAPGGILSAQMTPPVKVTGDITPVSVNEPAPGVFVFDMGQNFSGWTQLRVEGPAGTVVKLRYDERLSADGFLDQQNACYVNSGEFQTDHYILKGGGVEVWEPRFVYHGFQYVQVTGFPGKPTVDSLKGRVVHTAFDSAGTFECSNDVLNRIQRNTLWSYVSNFVGYPTDCPHREKNGWTGDAHLACNQGLMNFDSQAAYTKWLNDFKDEQPEKGDFPGIVPTSGWGYDIGPAWDSAYILIPWYLYEYCGDTRILETHYAGMKRLVDYLTTRAENGIVSYGLSDWCPPKGETPNSITSTGYYYVDAVIVSKAARLLGNNADAEKYAQLAESVKAAFNAKFYHADTGAYLDGSQTEQSLALYQGFVPQGETQKVVDRLAAAVEAENGHLDCGILGTKYLLHALTDNGRVDLAYRVASQTTFPSWGHWLEQGATTLWENWNGESSRCHIMFGDISAWFYEALGGIELDPETPGFKHIVIRPRPVGDLTWAKAEHRGMYGPIRSAWRIENGVLTLDVHVPVNTTATVYVPAPDASAVKEGGAPAKERPGIEAKGSVEGAAAFVVGSGDYRFTAPWKAGS